MRIAVIADTHDRCPESVPARIAGADEIWHLGDVCSPLLLEDFEALRKPLRVVRGNCDECDDWPLSLELTRENVNFLLVHIPPTRAPGGVAALLHGHTHVVRDELIDGVRWLNPGSLSRPRTGAPSFAWLTVEGGTLTSWEVVRI